MLDSIASSRNDDSQHNHPGVQKRRQQGGMVPPPRPSRNLDCGRANAKNQTLRARPRLDRQ